MLTAWPFNDFRTRIDADTSARGGANERRLVLCGIPNDAATHFGALISDVPLRPSWRGVVTDRVDQGRLSLPDLGSVSVFAAADASRLENIALNSEATDVALCVDSELMMEIDRLVPMLRPLRRLQARSMRLSVVVIGLGAAEERYSRFVTTLTAARAVWPVYRVGRQDPLSARLTTRMLLHAPLSGPPAAVRAAG